MMEYIIMLVAIMILTVIYLVVGGISLLKGDEEEQNHIEHDLRAALK